MFVCQFEVGTPIFRCALSCNCCIRLRLHIGPCGLRVLVVAFALLHRSAHLYTGCGYTFIAQCWPHTLSHVVYLARLVVFSSRRQQTSWLYVLSHCRSVSFDCCPAVDLVALLAVPLPMPYYWSGFQTHAELTGFSVCASCVLSLVACKALPLRESFFLGLP